MTGRRLQILIVVDDPQLLAEFEQAAATWGHEVVKAETSREAIRLIRHARTPSCSASTPRGGARTYSLR